MQIAAGESFTGIVRDQLVTSASAALPDLPNGAWFARVRGIDADGIEGFDAVRPVQVLMPPPPPELPPRQRMITCERLELSNGRHLLRFTQDGLDVSHTITATVVAENAASAAAPLIQACARGDTAAITFDLGPLTPPAPPSCCA